MISIIIPVYNVEQFLPMCIESVLGQSFSDFELILVNDGSSDGSLSICEDYAQKDPRVVVLNQKNTGVSAARNNGLGHARGEWVTFIDSDDWVDNSFLEDYQIEHNSDADMICQGLKYVNHSTGTVKRNRCFGDDKIVAPDIEGKMENYDVLSFGVTVCKCFKKSVIEANNICFDEQIAYHEDHIFTLSYIYHAHTITTVDACGYNYRCGHNASSLSKRRHPIKNQVRAGQLMMERLREISSVFQLSDAYYKKIATFCLESKINAVREFFKEKATLTGMKEILSPISEIAYFYYPDDKRYGIIRNLAKDKSGVLLYLFFNMLSKLSKK